MTVVSKNQNSGNSYNSEFLQCFWDLANENQSTRVAAGIYLLNYLNNHSNNTAALLEYTLNRLVRGLASFRYISSSSLLKS